MRVKEKFEQTYSLSIEGWQPRTLLGKKVLQGQYSSFDEVLDSGLPLFEEQIVCYFFPNLNFKTYPLGFVNKTTKGGRKRKSRVFVVAGSKDGYLGCGMAKANTVGLAFNKAKRRAIFSLRRVNSGCGSFDCECGGRHSLSSKKNSKVGSMVMEVAPLRKGKGLLGSKMSREIGVLCGLEDALFSPKRSSKVKYNQGKCIVQALISK